MTDDPGAILAMLLVLLAPPDAAPLPARNLDEAERLADELIKSKLPEGYLLKAQVLAARGNFNASVKEAVKGLKVAHPGPVTDGVEQVLARHPALQRDDGSTPRPMLAERQFNQGLEDFVAGRFADAEQAFAAAILLNNADARFYYYEGLARVQQGKAEQAVEDFRQGADLERRNKPNPKAVDASLERVQGKLRQAVTEYRK
jgi:tetratricopeptide (TPR) repeat protein